MSIYLTEEEQVQEIKKFIKAYGPSIILGIVLALGGSYTWKAWQQHRLFSLQQASTAYEQMLEDFSADKVGEANKKALFIIEQYKRTPYAKLAALRLARVAVEKNELDQAWQHLEWVVVNSNKDGLKDLAVIRQARILLAKQQWQQAIDKANTVKNEAYAASCSNIKAMAYQKLGEKAQAHAAYQIVLDQLPVQALIKPIIEMQLSNLPMEPHSEK